MRLAQTAVFVLGLALFTPAGDLRAFQGAPSPAPLADREYHFTVGMPAGWTLKRKAKDRSSFLRLVLQSPDRLQSIEVYGLKNEENVDLEKLAAHDRECTASPGI